MFFFSIIVSLLLAAAPSAIFIYRVRSGNRPKTWGNYATWMILVTFYSYGLIWVAEEFQEVLGGGEYWLFGIFWCGLLAFLIAALILLPWRYEDY